MKKNVLLIITFLFLAFGAFAQEEKESKFPISQYWAKFLDSTDFYAGGAVDFGFPLINSSQTTAVISSAGAGLSMEGGVQWKDWQFGLEIDGYIWGHGDGTAAVFENGRFINFDLTCAREFTKETISFLPEMITFRPKATLGFGYFTGKFFGSLSSYHSRDVNRYLRDKCVPVLGIGALADYELMENLTVFGGPQWDLWIHGNGVVHFVSLTAGVQYIFK